MHCFSITLLFCFLPLLASCEEPKDIDNYISKEALDAYNQFKELKRKGNIDEAFLFFTDPHLLSAGNMFSNETKNYLVSSFSGASELYNAIPSSFCLCGGDWLNDGDTHNMAKEKLLFADKQMKAMFSRYYKMMGNHDTNYLGVASAYNNECAILSREFIDKSYFSETGSAYYSFMGDNTLFYVLDSGTDWDTSMNDYRWEQLSWLADCLAGNTISNLALCIHVFYSQGELPSMSQWLVKLVDAFNSKRLLEMNGRLYDYTNAYGKVLFILSGHNHKDDIIYVGDDIKIPVIQTCRFIVEGRSTYDLCIVDYGKNVMNIIRIGCGSSRQVKLYEHIYN